ncbi:microtubule interacting and transport domain-containing protein [Hirsutella rhossiliensis]|uniref:Microtubule interacting and transport domain-containing protein n=1 Tax=Hirsutella rhossiliensis TaxID=111463 RepID=A0A9P8SML5_9HYPO|nr:microtubule interacting and transport domain-containing protein [Hirsutella rhossiliensis]KAH0967444.1 microtubule interacting and transport domain-containing protein [Hirsutella rhossiliensis]
MSFDQGRDALRSRGHSRSRSGKGSADLTKSKAPSQKAMLSRALEKANTAVQLDNAQNLEGARLAYSEACELLQQVLQRTTGDEDKQKLEAIRRTYSSRIEELDKMGPWDVDSNKALPARPGSAEYQRSFSLDEEGLAGDGPTNGTANTAGHANPGSRRPRSSRDTSPQTRHQEERHPRNGMEEGSRPSGAPQKPLRSSFSRPPPPRSRLGDESQSNDSGNVQTRQRSLTTDSWDEPKESAGHLRDGSQNSWLDPIDESGGSTRSSVHSRISSIGFRKRHLRNTSTNTEAEFDTALDAAIDAAYDDGYEPTGANGHGPDEANEEVVKRVLRRVEMARERVRQTKQEVYDSEMHRRQQQQRRQRIARQNATEGFYDDDSSEEEERMLEEMARGYGIDHFIVDQERRPSVSRPASRGVPGGSSQPPLMPSSAPETKGFSGMNGRPAQRKPVSKNLEPSAPPPTQSLPELPAQRSTSAQSVRNRRLSGQNPKQLKIDTSERRPPPPTTFDDLAGPMPKSAPPTDQNPEPQAGDAARLAKRRESPRTAQIPTSESMFLESPPNSKGPIEEDETATRRSGSPSTKKLRKNFSSSSLRSMKSRNVSLSNADDGMDMSPGTPSSSNQLGSARTAVMPTLPTPLSAAFRENTDGSGTGGLQLFEDNFHLPGSPNTASATSLDGPVPLEPCPNDFMLRPFWLMRCLYQTLVHPRGGYLSTKLFVPRDVWKVKGVKLKNVEDKIASCDFLTAALLKFAKVDTCDADAVLDEMQALEGALEQIQATLSRKLGNEVGVHSSGILFKEASNVVDGDGASAVPRATSISSKSSSFSWRRLRSKNSAIGLAGTYSNRPGGADGPKEIATMPTLPMTTQPTNRPAKRDVGQAQFLGPNTHYMSSLARLFDAAQAVDQIARQVEDPGLRHADKTQVGLELCTRHAAEFFGFYICRFVLTDLGLLLDKFIKRGSEWVLA